MSPTKLRLSFGIFPKLLLTMLVVWT